ncbi:MAG: hypothetical protein MRY83_00180 [Flavobacteriales bacterium]|nr:hypothetical protein [Flavobacteriales bacterium]
MSKKYSRLTKQFFLNIYARWKSYWFNREGTYSIEMARISLAIIYIYTWIRHDLIDASYILRDKTPELYVPKSIWVFFGDTMPSEQFLDLIVLCSKIAPFFLLIGLFSRTASILSLVSNLMVRAMVESFYPGWSHGFNVIFLAHLAFIFAPVGNKFSIDTLIKKGKSRSHSFWPVLLSQWAVALMFFMAFYWKVLSKSNVLDFKWVFSNSMRNHIIDRYIGVGEQVPNYLVDIIEIPLAFKTLALGNIIFQLLPVFACFMIRKPLLRLLFGCAFVIEEIGLSLVMQLDDLQWIPLITFFIDWDYLLSRSKSITQITLNRPKRIRLYSTFIFLFLGFYLGFGTNYLKKYKLGVHEIMAYPFSTFAMYSQIKDGSDGQPYQKRAIRFEVFGSLPEEKAKFVESKLQRQYYNCHVYETQTEVNSFISSLKSYVYNGFDTSQIDSIRIFRAIQDFNEPGSKTYISLSQKGLMAVFNLNTDQRLISELDYSVNNDSISFVVSDSSEIEYIKIISKTHVEPLDSVINSSKINIAHLEDWSFYLAYIQTSKGTFLHWFRKYPLIS